MVVEAALKQLGIDYREYPFREGRLFFCKLPGNDLTFDLQYSEDGTIHLWRFVNGKFASWAGKRCEYRKPKDYHSAIGIDVSEDGETSLFVEQMIDENEPEQEAHIKRIISSYVNLLSDSSIRSLIM